METVKLNNGIEMPVLGLGTFLLTDPDTCERSISEAIRIGYRLIDTAQGYGNEEYIGRAVAGSDVARMSGKSCFPNQFYRLSHKFRIFVSYRMRFGHAKFENKVFICHCTHLPVYL